MSVADDDRTSDDALLVAYIDGALDGEARSALERRLAGDAALRARLALLTAGGREFSRAFGLLLDAAPADRLAAMLAQAEAGNRARMAMRGGAMRRRFMQVAAGVVLFALGAAAGLLAADAFRNRAAPPVETAAEQTNWRAAVAEYLTLSTSETLAQMPEDEALKAKELAAVGAKLQLELTPDNVALPAAELKRAQLYSYHDMPLAQISYLSPADGPLAFCVIVNGKPDHEPAFEVREGFNIVYWNRGGRGYLVIGHASRNDLERLAGTLRAQVS